LPNIIAKGYETLNYVGFRVVGVEEWCQLFSC
jgi:hypothetical protein